MNCGLAKTGRVKNVVNCVRPAYDVQRSLGRMCGPTYVVYYTYASGDAQSLAIQYEGQFSLLTLAVTQRKDEQEATKLQKQVITDDL